MKKSTQQTATDSRWNRERTTTVQKLRTTNENQLNEHCTEKEHVAKDNDDALRSIRQIKQPF